jgi:citronellol/citronellal dehydrogenase
MPVPPSIFAPDLFAGQTVLVTGGGTGIGLETCKRLVALGASVAICGRRPEVLDKAVAELGERAFGQPCDIRDADQVTALVAAVMNRFGRIDALINNAGGQFPAAAELISPRGFEAVVRNNLLGTWNMTREVATKAMIPQQGGRIVNVIAQIFRGFPGMAHTGAARAGVENLTMTLAVEWAQHRILVNALAPGVITSSGTERYPKDFLEVMRAGTPLKRLGSEAEVADTILFMLSPPAAFMTGSTIYLDGGARLWGNTWSIPEPRP